MLRSPKLVRSFCFSFALGSSLLSMGSWDSDVQGQERPRGRSTQANNPSSDSPTQESKQTDERLDLIEKKLTELIKELKSIRAGDATTESSTASRNTKPAKATSLKLDPSWLKEVPWRSIGPANMGGRITDIAVHEKDPSLWWVATASGGLLKTKNQGVTVEHQFDHENTVSIGAISTDPTNPDVLWVGTGEANPRNSVSYGDGIYKSTDGGKTWVNKGLKETFQIGKILVHPKNPNTVYVGALGRLYGPNAERGVYRTTNGGDTWEKIFFVDQNTGVIDMIMHPDNPDILIAAFWDRLRDGFDSWPGNEPKPEGVDGYDPIRKWGAKGGLYKTSDGGATWKKLTQGLPTSPTGRIGLDWQTNSPHTIYAIVDCEDIGKGPKPFDAYLGLVGKDVQGKAVITQVIPDSPAAKAGIQLGDVLQKVDEKAIEAFDALLDSLREKKIGKSIQLELMRGDQNIKLDVKLTGRPGTNQQAPAVYLGITGEDKEGKVVVTRVVEGGPVAKAGVKVGDILVSVQGKALENYAALTTITRDMSEGDKLPIQVLRGEEKLDLVATLELRPDARPQTPAQSNVFLGMTGQNHPEGGAVMLSISEDGPAEKAGMKAGDIVEKLDGKKLQDYDALVAAIRASKPGDKMKLTVKRGESTKEIEVTLADRLAGSSQLRPYTYSYFGQSPNVQDQQGSQGHLYGGVYRSRDAGETWERVNSLNTRPMYFSVIRVDPSNDQRVYVLGVSQFRSSNGGVTFTGDFGRSVHADSHDLWIDPRDGRHMIIGGDGGFYVTYDYGDNWDHINNAAVGQFYHVAISPKQPYWVFGGLQDNGSWGGPAISKTGGAINEDWISVGSGDGFVCRVDPNDPDLVYYESQNGSMGRYHLKTGERSGIRPVREDGKVYRFNWNSPFILSNANSKIFYAAGNYVFRSLDRGNDLRAISPEITHTKRGSATALAESSRNPNVLYVGSDDGALWVTKDGGHDWKEIGKNLKLPKPIWVSTIEPSRFVDGRVYICLDAHRLDDDRPYLFVSEDFGETFQPIHEGLPVGSTRCLREDRVNPDLLYLGTEFSFWASLDRGAHWTKFQNDLPTVAIHEVAQHPTNGEIVLATHGRSLWAADVTGLRQIKPEHLESAIAFHDPTKVTRWRTEASRGRTNRRYVGSNPGTGASLWYSLPKKAQNVSIKISNIEGKVVNEIRGNVEPGLHRVNWNLALNAAPPQGAAGGRGTRSGTRERPDASTPSGNAPARSEEQQEEGDRSNDQEGAPSREAPTTGTRPSRDAGSSSEAGPARQRGGGAGGPGGAGSGAGGPGGGGAGGGPGAGQPFGRGGFGGTRIASNGVYLAVLVVDGKEIGSKSIVIERDPNVPEDGIADELYEERLLEEQKAAEAKRNAKSEGKGVYIDN